MRNKINAVITLILMAIIFTGCIDTDLPIYEMINSTENEGGFSLVVDGVKYIQYPATKWHIQISSNIIGYAGTRKIKIVEASGDSKRNFIILIEPGFGDISYPLLHQVDIQEPSGESINSICYSENIKNKGSIINNWVTSKDLIHELFYKLESGERILDTTKIKKCNIVMSCYSDKVPGAVYLLSIARSGNRLMCGNYNEGYVEISIELLEKIAGHEISIEELLAQ